MQPVFPERSGSANAKNRLRRAWEQEEGFPRRLRHFLDIGRREHSTNMFRTTLKPFGVFTELERNRFALFGLAQTVVDRQLIECAVILKNRFHLVRANQHDQRLRCKTVGKERHRV